MFMCGGERKVRQKREREKREREREASYCKERAASQNTFSLSAH
jgi:hypothetical protein